MKPSHALCVIVLGLSLSACEEMPSPTSGGRDESPTPMARDEAPFDVVFLDTMAKHHEEGVHMARLAEGRVQRPELRDFVKKMQGDQQREIHQMRAWRSEWFSGAPAAERAMAQAMDMSHLETMAPGPDYDLMFIDMMIPHHESAVELSQEALTKATRDEVRGLAQRIIDVQQREIEQLRRWKAGRGQAEQGHGSP